MTDEREKERKKKEKRKKKRKKRERKREREKERVRPTRVGFKSQGLLITFESEKVSQIHLRKPI
ncbi:MAG: hypothetical protein SNH88_06310 [Rikenellaceae bacterium]